MSNKFNTAGRLTTLIALCLCFVQFIAAQNSAAAPTNEQITAKIDEYMNAAVKVEGFSGSILVARDGKPIVNKGYGMANIELNVPNTPDTVFRIGSVTKQFTAMAIMMLAERGKLNVNDPACKYLTDCPAAWQSITVKNLLTHTAGVPNYTSFPDFAKTAALPATSAEMIGRFRDKPLDFAVGEKYAYSNSGYYLLGAIIEKVSGKSYADFLQENIFTPLGMRQSGYDVSARVIKNRASGYAKQGGEFVNASYMDMTLPGAAGAIYSTTGDMLLWDQALYTEKLVSRKALDETFTPVKSNYGYGWSIGKQFDRQVIGHGGNIFGFASHITRFPADKITVIVLSNVQGAPSGKIANDLSAIVFGAAYEIPKERKEIAVDQKVLEKYVGQYELAAPKIVLNFTIVNGKLFGELAGQSKFALSAESETVFFSKDAPVQITFTRDANGATTGMTFSQGGANIPAQKIK
jgi:CubicO group peptidase (beta-lactamase class C family)